MPDLTADVRSELDRRLPDLTAGKRLDAVVEAARASLLVAVPRLRAPHQAALERRGPDAAASAPSPRRGTDVFALVALFLAVAAPALVVPSPRTGRPAISVDDGGIWVGLLAAASFAVFAGTERGRRDSRYFGAHTKNAPRVFLIFAIIWTLAVIYMVLNWDQVDRYEPFLPMVGVILIGVSTVGMFGLFWIARSRDRIARADPDVASKDEWGRKAGDADPVEAWWAGVPLTLSPAERGAGDRAYAVTIDALEERGIIRPQDARRLRQKKPPVVWRGDAG